MHAGDKRTAIGLRKQGKTYAEILAAIPVAKSTLSQWLGSVGLTARQTQRITRKRIAGAKRGAEARRTKRLREVASAIDHGRKDIGFLTSRELWLIGIALYWAEGSKQRESSVSTGIVFGNSDVRMVAVFLQWLRLLDVNTASVWFELYVHQNRKAETRAFQRWWARELQIPISQINRVYYKRGSTTTNRKNIGDLYHGLLRIRVKSSTMLNRRINGWLAGIVASVGSGVTGNTPAFEAGDSRIEA